MKRLECVISLLHAVPCCLALSSSPALAQTGPIWPADLPPPFLQGPTLVETLRNGVRAAVGQARATTQSASRMGRRAMDIGYQMQNLWADYQNLENQFQNLCATFNALAGLAQQVQTARAANAAAELESGLNIIAEAFAPVRQQIQAGVLDRNEVVRMCQVLNEALNEWQKELKRCSARLGTIQ